MKILSHFFSSIRSLLAQGRVTEEGRLYLDKQFLLHVKLTVPPALMVVGLLFYFEFDKFRMDQMTVWSVIMVGGQLLRYFLAHQALVHWERRVYRSRFFILDYLVVIWWTAYLFIMGVDEVSEAHYLWRGLIVYLVLAYYLTVMRYSLPAVIINSLVMNLGMAIYLMWFTNIPPDTKVSLMVLQFVGLVAMLLFGWSSYLIACKEFRVVADNRALMLQLNDIAILDPLTKIYNRRYFSAEISKFIEFNQRLGKPFSVAIFDIDFFKKVNDTYGHTVGDQVLVQLSQFVRESLRKTDVFARFGGEEFVIILPELSKEDVERILNKLRERIAEQVFECDTVELGITVSIGGAEMMSGDKEDDIIKRADEALYQAKQAGRNLTKFNPA